MISDTAPLGELIRKALIDTGTSPKQAAALAKKIITWGSENGLSGSTYYWPQKYKPLTPKERHAGIRQDFKGGNLKEVCEKYCVTPQCVYQIIRN